MNGWVVQYKYERGEHRIKHRWRNDYAGFIRQHGHLIGKCPATITEAIAETVLNQAVAEPDPFVIPGRAPALWPKRLYGVYEGVIYEAVPTEPGKSYHGYPWRGREGRGPLPSEVVSRLRELASAEGHLEEFEDWLDQYS
jgi:hypothetical protein